MRDRNFTMDKVRMVAALIVMMGHLLHVKGDADGFLIGTHIESILSSGSFAVVVFFGLSGIALRFQTDKHGISTHWLMARIIRLMPVYWITLLPPIIGCYLIGIDIEYPSYGFVIAAFGLQAISPNLYIPPVNGPLWSLSVELYLSASLLVIGRWKRVSSLYILALLILINLLLPSNTILQGLPIFYFGYLCPGFNFNLMKSKAFKYPIILVPLLILFLEPRFVQSRFGEPLNYLVSTSLAALILIWTLTASSLKRDLLSDLSQRSYSLYAVHAPIMLFVDKIFFVNLAITSGLQILISIFSILVSTEILYRFVEKPSIKFSRRFLAKQVL
jgi:peptidoglycan/LPS O-acetylase OafA/YrhL